MADSVPTHVFSTTSIPGYIKGAADYDYAWKAVNVINRVYKIRTARTDSDGRIDISNTTEFTVSFRLKHGDKSVEVPESNLYLSIEEGTNMSAAWISNPGAARGSYLMLLQHDSGGGGTGSPAGVSRIFTPQPAMN